MNAPFPKWVYDLAVELERGIRAGLTPHAGLATLLPAAARTAAQVLVDYEELTRATAQPAPAPAGPDTTDTSVIPVVPLYMSPVADPGTAPTQMGPANGVTS